MAFEEKEIEFERVNVLSTEALFLNSIKKVCHVSMLARLIFYEKGNLNKFCKSM